jgi:hypothetical protein
LPLLALGVALAALMGCGGQAVRSRPANEIFSVTPGVSEIDTNCVGCNATNAQGAAVEQFRAILNRGGAAEVSWSLAGGDSNAGAGAITAGGVYTPPTFLTSDRVQVAVTATLKSDPAVQATATLTLTPGFQQPLAPQNAALGPGGAVTLTGTLSEAGGGAGVRFALSDRPGGTGGGVGSLGAVNCRRDGRAFTACSVVYTAPASVPADRVTYVVAQAGNPLARMEAAVLLNAGRIASNPAIHQAQLAAPAALGSSGGNANDYDAHGGAVVDCCSGTLGALVTDGGKQYILSNNHVLARSDQARAGDSVVQPGLIDNNCTPGTGAPVGTLTSWLPLSAAATNVDAALAEVTPHAVDPAGGILELGARQADGTLAAAPPGVSSSGGKGEAARLDLRVAKSGRTTGLTCGGVTAVDVDAAVDYFRDCAETKPYLTKTFTNQLGLSGNRFSDSGDSGALVVNAANAEPLGLYFAGGRDAAGVGQGMASLAGEVLSELGGQEGRSLTFVGGPDHAVSCLSYGDGTVAAAQAQRLSTAQIGRVRRVLAQARQLVNPATGVLGVAMGKSSDRPGEAALVIYVSAGATAAIPATVGGVRTMVIVADAQAVSSGAAPLANPATGVTALPGPALAQALAVKRQTARGLMERTPAFFGVGVGQSLDNPREAALVIYVDRKRVPAELPQTIDGVRTRYIVMDRLHVTRSFAVPHVPQERCGARAESFDPQRPLGLFQGDSR